MTSYSVAITGYCVLLAAVVALVVVSHRRATRVPTAGRLIGAVRSTRTGRVLLVLAWAWVGWHVFVR